MPIENEPFRRYREKKQDIGNIGKIFTMRLNESKVEELQFAKRVLSQQL